MSDVLEMKNHHTNEICIVNPKEIYDVHVIYVGRGHKIKEIKLITFLSKEFNFGFGVSSLLNEEFETILNKIIENKNENLKIQYQNLRRNSRKNRMDMKKPFRV